MLEDIIAIVLAGGVGGRLKPLTAVRSKPAVLFGGVYRLIDFTLSNCINSGVRDIKVLAQYRSRSLIEHMKRAWDNILSYRVKEDIELVHSSKTDSDDWETLGTADAIRKNIYLTRESHKERVLILAGDHVYKMDYRLMNQFHNERKSPLTIATLEVPVERARGDLGVLEVDEKGRIIGFEEKPLHPKTIPGKDTCIASMGIYLFDKDMLEKSLDNELLDFGKEVIPMLINKGEPLFSYDFLSLNKIKEYEYFTQDNERVKVLCDCARDSGTWYDVGKLPDFYAANMDLVSPQPLFNLYGEKWPLFCAPVHLPPGKTVHDVDGRRGAAFNSLVSNGAIVSGATVRRSIIGPLTYIHSWAVVEDSYLMGGEIIDNEHNETSIGRNCRIRNAIIDKNVVIPQGMTIGHDRNEDENINKFTVEDLKEPTLSGGTYIVCIPKGWPNPEHEQWKK